MLSVVNNDGTTETGSLMDDIVREGARRMLAAALEAEVKQSIAELAGERDEVGRRLVVRNGRHRERTVTTAAGDGAMGLWRALAEVFPQSRHQRCWVHKVRNVMNALPKSAQPGAKKALQEICNAEDRDHAEKAIKDFERAYAAKWPKATKKVTDEADELLAFYDFPSEHWVHLRTTNPIESTFSTVKLRTTVTRGAGSPAAALAMVFKLVESAQARWRAITAPRLVALVRNGARFENGHLVEHSEEPAAACTHLNRPTCWQLLMEPAPMALRCCSCRRRVSALLGSGRLAG